MFADSIHTHGHFTVRRNKDKVLDHDHHLDERQHYATKNIVDTSTRAQPPGRIRSFLRSVPSDGDSILVGEHQHLFREKTSNVKTQGQTFNVSVYRVYTCSAPSFERSTSTVPSAFTPRQVYSFCVGETLWSTIKGGVRQGEKGRHVCLAAEAGPRALTRATCRKRGTQAGDKLRLKHFVA